ncbi:MAG: hypothetical protein Q4F69_11320 [Bacteroidia bacterium]|nr:hypothetical protein [Bacteroidia bacterium]
MRRILSIVVCVAVMLVSCRKDIENALPAGGTEMTFNASISENNDKTYLDGYEVKWAEGDAINVNGDLVNLVSGYDTKNGVFRGNVTGIGDGAEKTYIAGYPADAVTYSNGEMKVSIPTKQRYDATKPLLGQMPMLAKVTGTGEEMTFVFENVANILKLNLYGNTKRLKEIIIHSSDAHISGEAAACSSSVEITSFTPDGAGSSHYIHIVFDNALTLSPDQNNPTPVYVIIPKITVATTLTVKMYAEDGFSQTERISADATTFNSSNMIYKTSAKLFSATENTHEIPALFSVGVGKQVMFTNGNIYWDGDSFEFENSQTARTTSWNVNHVSHFYWQPESRMTNSYSGLAYDGTDANNSDVFFTNFQNNGNSDKPNPDFTISGYSGKYRVLTESEKEYLLKSRDNCEKLVFKGVLKNESNLKVLIICPDGFTFMDAGISPEFTGINNMTDDTFANEISSDTKTKLEAAGAVILPVGGYKKEQVFGWNDVIGLYWLGDADATGFVGERANGLAFGFFSGYGGYDARNYGYMVRLVSDFGSVGVGSAAPFGEDTW